MPASALAEGLFPDGTKVVRGPDWNVTLDHNKDGGDGKEGIVIAQHSTHGLVRVRWSAANAVQNKAHRVGFGGLYEIKLAAPHGNEWLADHTSPLVVVLAAASVTWPPPPTQMPPRPPPPLEPDVVENTSKTPPAPGAGETQIVVSAQAIFNVTEKEIADGVQAYKWHTGTDVDAMTLGRTLQGIKGWASSYPAMKAKREAQAQEQLDVENAGTIGGDAADNSGSGSGTASAPFEHSAYDLAARGGNYDLAFSLSSVAAADGDPCAAFLLGVMYYEGKGVDVDCEKACSLFADAVPAMQVLCTENDPTALWNLADCYYNGYYVLESEVEAIAMFRKAAFAGHPDAPEIVKSLTGKAMKEFDREIQNVLQREAAAGIGGGSA